MNNNNAIQSYVVKAKSTSATTEAMTKLDAYLAGMFPKNEEGWSDRGDYYVQSNNSYAQDMESQNLMQSLVLGAMITVLGVGLGPWVLGLMNMPENCLGDASTYIRIYFAGALGSMVYNMGAGILRAMGDSGEDPQIH